MLMTVVSFWIGQLGMTLASHCPDWFNQVLVKCGMRKPSKKKKKNEKPQKKVAGKFCVFPLKRNRQIVAHIREPLRSKYNFPKE